MKCKLLRVLGVSWFVTALVCFSPAATTSVVPTTGISASNVTSNACSGKMWSCVDDPIGSPDFDTTYVFTTGTGQHTIGFTGYSGVSTITGVTLHLIAKTTNGASGTAQMKFYNNGAIAGTGGVKTLTGSYNEYVSDFTTSISDVTNITMEVDLTDSNSTGDVRYTAAWLDITYGGTGTTLSGMDDCIQKSQDSSGNPVDISCGTYVAASCTSSGCAGGAGGTTLSVSQIAPPPTDPDNDNVAAQIKVSGGNTGDPNALEYVKLHGTSSTDASTSMQVDWWEYWTASGSNLPNTLEFDSFWGDNDNTQNIPIHTAMFGSQCNMSADAWQVDPQDGSGRGWVALTDAVAGQTTPGKTVPCKSLLTENGWHHITWKVHHDPAAGKIYYDYLTVDSTKYIIGYATKVWGYKSTTSNWEVIGAQVQQDMNSSHQAFTEYVDSMSVTYW